MKTITQFLLFATGLLFMTSCSLSEEITFNKDGSLQYSYTLDAGEFIKMVPDSANETKKPARDSIISFAELFEQDKDSISKLPIEEQKKLQALKSFVVKMHEDMENKEYTIQLSGNFKNTNDLNTALYSLSTAALDKNKKDNKSEKEMNFLTNTQYNWNGKTFKRHYNAVKKEENDSVQSMSTMFSGGTFKVKYNFPKKVKKVNSNNAVISSDRKSVVIEYKAVEYLSSPEISDIEIELEK